MKKIVPILFVVFSFFQGANALAEEVPVKKISDNVYAVWLQYYHSLVVIGNEGVLITDPDPANAERAIALKAEIAKLTHLPVTKIVLSHEHYDHVGGTEVFPKAEIYAHQATKAVFRLDVLGQAPKKVDHYVGDLTTLIIGKTQVDLLHFGAADGVGALALHLPKERVVFSADLYGVDEITHGQWLTDINSLGTRVVLNALVAFEPKYSITTHSSDINPNSLKVGADFYNDLYAAVEPVIRKAITISDDELMNAVNTLPQKIKLPKYKNFGNYEHLPKHVERMVFSIFHGG